MRARARLRTSRDRPVDDLEPGCPGIVARSDGEGCVIDNRVVHRAGGVGIVVEMTGGTVRGNSDTGGFAGDTSIEVSGDGNTITGSVVRRAGACGLGVRGDANVVQQNTVVSR